MLPETPAGTLISNVAIARSVHGGPAMPPAPETCRADMLGANQPPAAGLEEFFNIATGTGVASGLGNVPNNYASEIEHDVVNNVLYATAGRNSGAADMLETIDPLTGASLGPPKALTGLALGEALNGLEFVGTTLYGTVTDGVTSRLVTIDPPTGIVFAIGVTGQGPISGLAFDATTGTMYGVTGGGGASDLVTINLATGLAAVVGSTGVTTLGSLEIAPDGVLYGAATIRASGNFYRINKATGASTLVRTIPASSRSRG